jgi:hypothetical protein
MKNLYEELISILTEYNKTLDDIEFISMDTSSVYSKTNMVEIDKNNFITVAKKTNYDDDYGGIEIPSSLMIVGKDWWLERHEYDGSEWFEFKTIPTKPDKIETIDRIRIDWSLI